MTDSKYVTETLKEIKDSVEKIHDKLNPVILDTALNKSSLKRAWWFLGAIALTILGACSFIVRGALS